MGRLDYGLAVVNIAVNIASLVALALTLLGLALGSCGGDAEDHSGALGGDEEMADLFEL